MSKFQGEEFQASLHSSLNQRFAVSQSETPRSAKVQKNQEPFAKRQVTEYLWPELPQGRNAEIVVVIDAEVD